MQRFKDLFVFAARLMCFPRAISDGILALCAISSSCWMFSFVWVAAACIVFQRFCVVSTETCIATANLFAHAAKTYD